MQPDFHTHGVEIYKGLLSREFIDQIQAEIDLHSIQAKHTGIRNLEKKYPCIEQLSKEKCITGLANSLLDGEVRLVRALFFDKTPDKNWYVTWHQDKTVTLNKKTGIAGLAYMVL